MLRAVEWLNCTKKTMIHNMRTIEIKNTTHCPACETAAAGQGCIRGVREEHAGKTGMAGLTVGGGKHSGTTGGVWAWGGQLGIASQNLPGYVGAKVFAAHLPAGSLLDLDTTLSRDCGKPAYPLIDSARCYTEPLGKINLTAVLEVSF